MVCFKEYFSQNFTFVSQSASELEAKTKIVITHVQEVLAIADEFSQF